jgi:NAD-dependent dihydropyrimidine dehydrogenase PreA subunit
MSRSWLTWSFRRPFEYEVRIDGATEQYCTTQSFSKEECGTMYMVTIDKGKCDGDGTCANVCPQSVFKVEGGKADPVNMSECINCLTCVENCPQQAITVNEI